MLKAIVFGVGPLSVRYMCQMCAEIPDLVVIRSLDALPKPRDLGRIMNAFGPQLVLLEADSDERSRDLAQALLELHADTPLITFRMQAPGRSDWNPASLGLISLEVPFSAEDFQEALYRVLARGPSNGVRGRLIAFLPAKGGNGATTMSLTAATMVAQQLQKRVLLLECDIPSGPVAAYLSLRPTHSIVDVLEDSHLLDSRPFSQLVVRHQKLDILPSVGRRPTHRLSAWSCQRLLSRARGTYDFVFCDLPDVVDESFEPVLRGADQVVLVTTPSEASGFLTERRLNTLAQLGVGSPKISVVMNRARASEKTLDRIRHVAVSVSVPNQAKLWDDSRFDLSRMTGNGNEQPLMAVAEICAGQPLPSGRQQRSFSLASFWSNVVPGMDR